LREWRRNDHVGPLAARLQGLREGKAAAQRVAVCVLVAEDQDLVVAVDQLLQLVDARQLRDAHRGPSSAGGSATSAGSGRISRRRLEMCTEYSIDGSISKRSSGENLRFSSLRPSCRRMTPEADRSPD